MAHEFTGFSSSHYPELAAFSPASQQDNMYGLLAGQHSNTDASETAMSPTEDANPSIATGMETAEPEPVVNASFQQQVPLPWVDAAICLEISHLGVALQPELDSSTGVIQESPLFVGDMDPSTATDQEIWNRLHAASRAYDRFHKQEGMLDLPREIADLTRRDPWELQAHQRCYLARRHPWLYWLDQVDNKRDSVLETSQGFWKKKQNKLKAILCRSVSSTRRYTGLQRTLEFYTKDGSKTNWVMHEYIPLAYSHELLTFFPDGIVFRKVFENGKDEVSYSSSDTANNGEPGAQLNSTHHLAQLGKRPRTEESDVWQHFTKIFVEVPEEDRSKYKGDPYKLVYAVCHHCEGVMKAATKNGTTHLKRHAIGCQNKQSQARSTCGTRPTASHVNPSACRSYDGAPGLLAGCGQA